MKGIPTERQTLALMRRRHLPSVLRIENRVYPRPWSLGIFLSEIALADSRHYYVCLSGRRVVGYCGLMVALEEGHITNVAVEPEYWGSGVGKRLLLNAFEVARKAGVKDMTLEVRASNKRAQHLYFGFGFQPVGIRKGYYQETNEDAIIMWAYGIDLPESVSRTEEIRSRLSAGPSTQTSSTQTSSTQPPSGETRDK